MSGFGALAPQNSQVISVSDAVNAKVINALTQTDADREMAKAQSELALTAGRAVTAQLSTDVKVSEQRVIDAQVNTVMRINDVLEADNVNDKVRIQLELLLSKIV